MFVRFRRTKTRLQVSLIETRRCGGKIRHEHIGSLGSIELEPSIYARIEFWNHLHERLARLSNRLGGHGQAKVLGQVHTRIPMVTADEQRALQAENAEADVRFWEMTHSFGESTIHDHKGLKATTERKIAEMESTQAETTASLDAAKKRLARIKAGEDVAGGLHAPKDFEQALIEAGFTKKQLMHFHMTSRICEALEALGEADGVKVLCRRFMEEHGRVDQRLTRKLYRALVRPTEELRETPMRHDPDEDAA
jgi:hypothetical protein